MRSHSKLTVASVVLMTSIFLTPHPASATPAPGSTTVVASGVTLFESDHFTIPITSVSQCSSVRIQIQPYTAGEENCIVTVVVLDATNLLNPGVLAYQSLTYTTAYGGSAYGWYTAPFNLVLNPSAESAISVMVYTNGNCSTKEQAAEVSYAIYCVNLGGGSS